VLFYRGNFSCRPFELRHMRTAVTAQAATKVQHCSALLRAIHVSQSFSVQMLLSDGFHFILETSHSRKIHIHLYSVRHLLANTQLTERALKSLQYQSTRPTLNGFTTSLIRTSLLISCNLSRIIYTPCPVRVSQHLYYDFDSCQEISIKFGV